MDKKPTSDDRERLRELAPPVGDMALEHRETRLRAREEATEAREAAAESREIELSAREEMVRLRDEALRARAEADEIRADRERLLVQVRDANERLVVASLQADELAEAAACSEERFRLLVTTSAVVVWQANAHGVVHLDPESWKAFTGMGADQLDPESGWLGAVHPKDRDSVRALWQRAIATSTPYTCEHRLSKSDGSYAWVITRAVPIRRAGVVREWIGMMTDVTDRRRVEETTDQFIGILGHDLRNPLSAIVIGAGMLSELPPAHARVVDRIAKSAKRMEVMVRDVLDFARGRLGGGIPVTLGTCDLARIGTELVGEMQQAHPTRELSFEAIGDLRAECDTDRIEQVLSNLIGNAVTHGLDPIRIRIRDESEQIVMTVSNQGPLIPLEVLPKLFEPFSRGVRETRSRGASEGLGLGLYIASEIVRAHGGAITVSSVQPEGTTFTVKWPRSAAVRARMAR